MRNPVIPAKAGIRFFSDARQLGLYDGRPLSRAIKKRRRAWKIELIENANPNWLDLFEHTASA
jgi:hypothetical protein